MSAPCVPGGSRAPPSDERDVAGDKAEVESRVGFESRDELWDEADKDNDEAELLERGRGTGTALCAPDGAAGEIGRGEYLSAALEGPAFGLGA